MSTPVIYDLVDGIAVVTVANPPVNALSQAVRQGLDDAFARFVADEDARIAVIVGAGRLFIGGADITEFGKPPQAPALPEVIARIEASAKPVVAVIHGAALGGGLEVALGAHYRIALKGATLGLPEVTLGVIPGAGGTQRTPRLTGLAEAARMISTGAPVSAERALELGLVDRLGAGPEPREVGIGYAKDLVAQGAGSRPVSAMAAPTPDGAALDAARAAAESRARGQVAPGTAIDAVALSARLPLAQGLAEERKLFLRMLDTPQRAGLIHAFLAERKVATLPELKGIAPGALERIGVVGGGTMGAGIATAALLRGLPVTLVERDAAAADKARDTIAGNLDAAVKRGKLDEAGRERILSETLETVTTYDALAQADLVIEAVFEDMEVKTAVFAELDRVAKPGAVLATNTSYLDIDALAATTSRPADVIGLHFFSPAHVMKLLEIVVAADTAPEVTATAFALAKRLGKTPVRAGVCDGFIGNRILSHYRAAADRMVLAGASPFQVDRALVDFGFAMGPYAVADLAGLDIGYLTRQRRAQEGRADSVTPTWADELYHLGRLGQKTGRGYYLYEGRKGTPDPEVEQIVARAREAAGVTPRDFPDDEIQRRYMAAMVNEGARVVDEGIARRPLDVDVTLLAGYGFPRWRGGPMKWADMQGLDRVLSDIRAFAPQDPAFWTPAPLLERLADENHDFDSLNG